MLSLSNIIFGALLHVYNHLFAVDNCIFWFLSVYLNYLLAKASRLQVCKGFHHWMFCYVQFIKLLCYLLNLQLILIYFHEVSIRHCSCSQTAYLAVSFLTQKCLFWRPLLKQHCPKVWFHFVYCYCYYSYCKRMLWSLKTPLVNLCYSQVLVKPRSSSAWEGIALLPPSRYSSCDRKQLTQDDAWPNIWNLRGKE